MTDLSINFSAVAERLRMREREKAWPNDPLMWCDDHGLFTWSKQKEVLQSVHDNAKTLVVTGNGVGKTYLASLAVTWWVDVHPDNDTSVVTTATNWRQVKNILWKEIPRAKGKAAVRGKVGANAEWKVDGRKDPIAFGMKPDDKDESGFQGVHDQYVLVVIDEAGGVSKEIFTAADAITTNKHARILAIANPNDPSGYMAEVYESEIKKDPKDRIWNVIQFGAFDSPNFTGEKVPSEVASRLVQKSWVEERKKEWGEDDPRYKARVLGQFPELSDDGLFNLGRTLQSMQMHKDYEYNTNAPVRLGVDVARYGSDFSVVTKCQDGYIEVLGKYKDKSGPELSRIVGDLAREHKAAEIRIDAIGVGESVMDNIDTYVDDGTVVYAIKGSNMSPDITKWINYRAAMYDFFSRDVSLGNVSLPDDDELYSEMRVIRYAYRGSALKIESKEDMRKRGIHSPDILDAVIYAALDIDKLAGIQTDDQYTDADTIMEETFDEFPVDEWGNEIWSIFPA